MTSRLHTRRHVLKGGAGLVAATGLATPLIAQERTLRVGTYGGFFEDSFIAHVYPAFTEATGIGVESVTQPNSADWLISMQQAQRAGSVPADLSLYGRATLIRATREEGLLSPLDMSAIPNADMLDPYFVYEADPGVMGVGAMSWFSSMVVNSDEVETPESWTAFWDTDLFEASLGMNRQYDGGLMDIIAATYFDGEATFDTEDGIRAIVEKAAELKPNVALWWSAESQMEQSLQNYDVIGGTYYHDVANLMAAGGFPIRSVFPREGNPQDYGSWALSGLSERGAEAAAFVDFTSSPETQALMSRQIGTAPLMPEDVVDLSAEEFAAVSGTPAIRMAYEAYLDRETFIQEAWDAMLAAG